MKFKFSEKLAIIHLIDSIILADGLVHSGELNALNEFLDYIDFDSSSLIQARSLDANSSVDVLKKMSEEKKDGLAIILNDVAKSDGFIHHKERTIIENVFKEIGLKKVNLNC